jgi:hypothetical protein
MGAGGWLSESHHPSSASRVGIGIRLAVLWCADRLWTVFVQLLAAMSAGVQECFADFVQVVRCDWCRCFTFDTAVEPHGIKRAFMVASIR